LGAGNRCLRRCKTGFSRCLHIRVHPVASLQVCQRGFRPLKDCGRFFQVEQVFISLIQVQVFLCLLQCFLGGKHIQFCLGKIQVCSLLQDIQRLTGSQFLLQGTRQGSLQIG